MTARTGGGNRPTLTSPTRWRYPGGKSSSTSASNGTPLTTVTVSLSEAARQQLDQWAAERGVPLEEYARTVLEQEATTPAPQKSADEWIPEWRTWAASHPRRELTVDDSRESIYEGCGE
jgi:hypothetical protein